MHAHAILYHLYLTYHCTLVCAGGFLKLVPWYRMEYGKEVGHAHTTDHACASRHALVRQSKTDASSLSQATFDAAHPCSLCLSRSFPEESVSAKPTTHITAVPIMIALVVDLPTRVCSSCKPSRVRLTRLLFLMIRSLHDSWCVA
jgi:hypothetical protein